MISNTAYQPSITIVKTAVIQEQLQGYFGNDMWDLTEPIFEKYSDGDSWAYSQKKLRFTLIPSSIRDEIKFFFANQIVNKRLSPSTMINYSSSFKHLSPFLKKYYHNIKSLVDIPYNHGLLKYKTFLTNTGIRIIGKGGYNTNPISAFNSIFNFLFDFYDTRNEFEKDVWDIRRIPNARYTINKAEYLLSFEKIPTLFRKTVKNYCKYALTYLSHSKVKDSIKGIGAFIEFIHKNHSDWSDFSQLKREEIEKFLSYFTQINAGLSQNYKYILLSSVKSFLEYLQRSEHSDAPQRPIITLFFKEDFPKTPKPNENQIKYIPETVMNQLELLLKRNPEDVTPPMDDRDNEYVPIAILLMATGWRISDILNLRIQNCLITTNNGYYLQGDIPKTEVKQHRIPIDKEVATVLQAIIDQTKNKSTQENNPKGYLFVRTRGKRKG
ncbi:tyrosine-type recombinase/integrase, partial [Qipengyuania zhejiangensis]|uniref:tyrosine-type recombinase/integrase n=1 Tax=Qipengyuania zhejiangensis TaxID=3077782 RepID=UPI002D782D98